MLPVVKMPVCSRVRVLAGRHYLPQALPAPGGVVVGPDLGLGGDLDQGVVRGA